jgi:hypothetical protein
VLPIFVATRNFLFIYFSFHKNQQHSWDSSFFGLDGSDIQSAIKTANFCIDSRVGWVPSTAFLGCVVFLSKNLDQSYQFLGSSERKTL